MGLEARVGLVWPSGWCGYDSEQLGNDFKESRECHACVNGHAVEHVVLSHGEIIPRLSAIFILKNQKSRITETMPQPRRTDASDGDNFAPGETEFTRSYGAT